MEQVDVTINQNFFLFCCTEKYNISCRHHSLPSKSNYFLQYTYPDGTTADASAQLSSTNVLTSQSPEHDYSCTVHARLYTSGEHAQTIVEFSLDLVSPVEYLFRKFSANKFDMSEKISNKMTSALLAMSLSYYFVMGEHVEKEMRRTDEILSTLLGWSSNGCYLNVTNFSERKEGTGAKEGITLFAQHYKLQKTLRHLSQESNVGDLPVHLPKSFLPPVEKIPPRRPAIIPRTRSNTLPSESRTLPVADTKHVSKSSSEYSPLQPVEFDPQEGYMYMEKPDQFDEANSDVPDNSDNEDEYFMPVDDDFKMHHQKPLKASKSNQISNSPLSKTSSTAENVITDEVLYMLCDSTPVEVAAAAAAVKKRGPPPRPPVPYRESHTLDTAQQQSSVKCNSNRLKSTSSIESSDPLVPRKKNNLFRKSKVKQ